MLRADIKIYYTLRIASAMCFIGHGSFGIITKQVWCNYFAVFGIGQNMADHFMPWLGVIDILLGLSLLIYPTRAVLFWLVIWGTITALLRPLSGEPFAEFIERAGNYGAPLALLIWCSAEPKHSKSWFKKVDPVIIADEKILIMAKYCLRIVVFLLLTGHGWLNHIGKKRLLDQYAMLGFSNTLQVAHTAGIFEIAAALSILIRPVRAVVFALFIWKISTELFYPHWEIFEWIERGGSYGCILALFLMLPRSAPWLQKRESALSVNKR